MKATVIAGLGALALAACDDASEVRVIAPDAATSTCIGDPKTPECAVETLLACLSRDDGRLCEVAILGAEHQLCKYSPSSWGCEAYAGKLGPGIHSDQAFGYDGLWSFTGDAIHYRITGKTSLGDAKIEPMGIRAEPIEGRPYVEIDVDRWVCTSKQSAEFASLDPAVHLPIDEPGMTLAHWLRSQWRRAETVLWEIRIFKEPYNWVWYDVGADYCWERLKYRAVELDGEWLMVEWTLEGPGECEDPCGCPHYRRPAFRKLSPVNADPQCIQVPMT
jgi:hypothetical protein